jgi:hypothetical protein
MVSYRSSGGGGGYGGGDDPNRHNNNNNRFSGSEGSDNWSLDTIFSMKDVSEKTRAHLTRVYGTLLTSTGTCALGMYLNATFLIQGFLMMLPFMIAFGYCQYQVHNPRNSENT